MPPAAATLLSTCLCNLDPVSWLPFLLKLIHAPVALAPNSVVTKDALVISLELFLAIHVAKHLVPSWRGCVITDTNITGNCWEAPHVCSNVTAWTTLLLELTICGMTFYIRPKPNPDSQTFSYANTHAHPSLYIYIYTYFLYVME